MNARNRAAAFIAAVWVMTALAALALVLAHSARVETLASANRLALAQANAAEKGAEQYALSAVAMEIANPGSVTNADSAISMQAVPIGNATVWILKPDPDDESALAFGLTDEAAKVDINHAGIADMLSHLPNLADDTLNALINWRSNNSDTDDAYYQSLPNPYLCKHAPFETVDELLLVKGFTPDLLFGNDRTRSGRADPNAGAISTNLDFGDNTSARGLAPFITVYGVQAATTPPPSTLTPSNDNTVADINAENPAALAQVLNQYLGSNAQSVLQFTQSRLAEGSGFSNIWDWAISAHLTSDQFSNVFHHVRTAGNSFPTRINLNSAPRQVLLCIPSFTDADADAVIAHRLTDPNPVDPSNLSWLLDAIPQNKLRFTGPMFTGASSCFSADILVCSENGRAFKRVRIVIDASSGTPKIIYRRDLTPLGWPLDPTLRTSLKSPHSPL